MPWKICYNLLMEAPKFTSLIPLNQENAITLLIVSLNLLSVSEHFMDVAVQVLRLCPLPFLSPFFGTPCIAHVIDASTKKILSFMYVQGMDSLRYLNNLTL